MCFRICESEFICAEYQLIGFGCIFSFDMLMELGENFVGHGYIIDRSRAVRFINVGSLSISLSLPVC